MYRMLLLLLLQDSCTTVVFLFVFPSTTRQMGRVNFLPFTLSNTKNIQKTQEPIQFFGIGPIEKKYK